MTRLHLANQNDHGHILCPYETIQKPNERFYLLNFFTSVMVVTKLVNTVFTSFGSN